MPSDTPVRSNVMCGHRYRDAHAAINWLCRAFGFERHAVYDGPDGTIAHAQLTFGGGMIFIASMNDTPFTRLMKQPDEIGGAETRNVYLRVPDADTIYHRATEAGAEIVIELHDPPYGGRGFTCRDLEGRLWSIGTCALRVMLYATKPGTGRLHRSAVRGRNGVHRVR